MNPTKHYLHRLLMVCIAVFLFGTQAQAAKIYYEFKEGVQLISFLASPNDADSVSFKRRTKTHEYFEYTRYNKDWVKATEKRYGRELVGYARDTLFNTFTMLQPKNRDKQYLAYEVVADSVVIYPDAEFHYKGVAYKGDVLPMNREYADKYAYSTSIYYDGFNTCMHLEVRDKNALKLTTKEANVEMMKQLFIKNKEYDDDQVSPYLWLLIAFNLVYTIGGFFLIRWICIKIREKMLRNPKYSNDFLYWTFVIAVTYLMFKMSQEVYTILNGWYTFFGVLACVLYWYISCIRIKNILRLRCNKCRIYPNDSVIDEITEGREMVSRTESRNEDYVERENDRERVDVNVSSHYFITDIHRTHTYHCHCRNCGHEWTFTIRGERLSSHVDREETTTTTTTTQYK